MMIRATKHIALAICVALLASCAIQKPPVQVVTRDSTVVNYIDSTVVSIRDSLVLVPIPAESSSAILPADFRSHVETSIAESDAYVEDGLLHHTIHNKSNESLPAIVPVATTAQVIRADSSHEGLVNRTVVKEVEKKLTWWQRFRIGAFFWLLALAVIGWRREIWSLVRRFIITT
jgi:hypothetical protein